MKTTSRIAMVAAASVLATSAMAADLGGNCCADLEERVAELEATTARKGNRRVSLTVYGHINEGVLFWDDGVETNAYVVTNENSRSRFGFRGDARISPEWTAGYLLEIGVRISNSASVNQLVDDNTTSTASLDLRHSAWYLDSNRLGRVWVGHTSMATDGITEINLSNASLIGNNDINNWGGGMFLRLKDGTLLARGTGSALSTTLSWNGILSQANANVGEGDRRNLLRYVSPTFWGFTFSSSWGEDDFWDVALRYANEWNGVRFAAGIGFQEWTDGNAQAIVRTAGSISGLTSVATGSQGDRGCADLNFVTDLGFINGSDVDCWAVGMSASVMHVPTGLYVAAAYGFLEDENRRPLFAARTNGFLLNADDRDEHWYVQSGIERNWFGLGKTTLYGEYFRADTGAGLSGGNARDIGGLFPIEDATTNAFIRSSTVDMWGIGLVQTIDAAAMDLYIGYRRYSGKANILFIDTFTQTVGETVITETEVSSSRVKFDDYQAVFAGGIIRF